MVELADHCEASAYLKDGKYLQFPICRRQKSEEVEWWKTFRKQIEEKENSFISLIPTKKPTILRRNVEGNLITLSHYVTMADLREKFETNSSVYSMKYQQLRDLSYELYGSLKMGDTLVFNVKAKQKVEENVSETTAVLVDCVNLLNRMWRYSILVEPVPEGALWGDLKENRKPIHLHISKEEIEGLAETAIGLAKLCRDAHAAKLIENEGLVEDLETIVTIVTEAKMIDPGSKLYPNFDVDMFPAAEKFPELSEVDEDMIAIQNDPWSVVPVNPSLPEIASSTESAEIKNQSESLPLLLLSDRFAKDL